MSRDRLKWSTRADGQEAGAEREQAHADREQAPAGSRDELLRELGDAVRANQRATDSIDEVVGQLLGVNRTDGRCLDILEQHGRISAGELAREAGLTSGAVTAVLDRLEGVGYVHRIADPDDRRRVLVDLTPEARAASWELFGPLAEAGGKLLTDYTDRDLQMLIEFHRRGIELQQRHVEFLRTRLRERKL